LPSCLRESSGLDFTGGSSFWSLSDSGDPDIHRVTNTGSLARTVTVTNANNRNWEDLTHDANRQWMYIGDFGNNNCDRTNLRIYRIVYPSNIGGTTTTAAEIKFSYPDQTRFPSPWMNFDAEAFFHFNGKLYIFTKADGSAVGYTKMYRIPDSPGTYVATLLDSFPTNDRTTSADISPDGSTVVLTSNTHIHIFRNFSSDHFFQGNHQQVNIAGGWTQKEAVSFYSANEIYMSDENTGSGNHLYYIDLETWIPAPPPVTTTGISEADQVGIQAYPNPASDEITVNISNLVSRNIQLSIHDLTGRMVYAQRVEDPFSPVYIWTEEYPSGIYFLRLSADGTELAANRFVISHK